MEKHEEILKKELGEELKVDVLLREYCTIGVGGLANFLYISKSIEDLINAVNIAWKNKIDFKVLGKGSNVIPSDYGFDGLIIVNESSSLAINQDKGEVIADSGVNISKLLSQTASQDLGGIEFLSGVPGTLGGAVYGNAGGKTAWIGDYVRSITLLEKISGELKVMRRDHDWMDFKYRSTILKDNLVGEEFKPIILSLKLRLAQKRRDSVLKEMRENQATKRETQPLSEKSAGSFFKNAGKLKEQSAGYMLDNSGAKKMSIGGAQVSKKHANFILNKKNSSAEDIRKLANRLKERVLENYHIELEEEVEYIGKW